MKQVLIETQYFTAKPLKLVEGTVPTSNPLVEGILATCEVKNGNGRYYSRELWEREMDKYMENVNANRALGELDHPDSSIINLKNVSHNIKKIWWDGDNVMGAIELLCWDFVSTPSNPGSYMKEKGMMNESKNNQYNKYIKANSIITEILCANGTCPIF